MMQGAAPRGRLWLVWVALLVPTLISALLLLRGNVARITQMADERTAIVVIDRLQETISMVQAYRFRVASNRPDVGEAVSLEADLARLEALYRSAPARVTQRENREPIEDAWSAIRHEVVPSEASLSELISALTVGVQSASDNSLITYDPDVAAINLGDAFAVQYVKSNVRFGAIASVVAHAQHAPESFHDRLAAARLETPALDAVRLGSSDVSYALLADASIDPSLGTVATVVERDATRYAALLDASYIDRAVDRTGALVRQGLHIATEQRAFQQRLERELDRNLVRRIAAERLAELGTVLIATLIAIASFAVVGATLRTLAQAQQFELVQAERKREQHVYAVERELFATQEQFRVTFEEVPVGILIVDEHMERMQANPALYALVANVAGILDDERDIVRALMADGGHEHFERRYRKRDATEAWAEVALRGVSGADGEKRYVLGTFRDITESRALAGRLVHEAQHDALTGLPNRVFLERSLRALIDGVKAGGAYVLCYLDLDDFKLVNDSVGHAAGDALLIATSKRLRAVLPPETLIARMGGDEFAILLAYDSDAMGLGGLQRIVETVSAPFPFDGFSLKVRASIGVVALGVASMRFEDVLRDADTAMYQAKARGGGQYVMFDASMHEYAKRRMQLTSDLIEAVTRDQIEVAYQPILDLQSERTLGFEALARWTHPSEGPIPPSEFVSIAEDCGIIESLGRSVLFTACEQLARWRAANVEAQAWTMNVNVAARQILNGSIVADVREALAYTRVPAQALTLEFTESVLIDNVRHADETLRALRDLGVRICIDDFGTGFSSLQYLQRFPVDGIKIDRSFISGADEGIVSEPIVEMLVTLSNLLDVSIVAEGIETRVQKKRLIALGCVMGQGFLFGKPAGAAEIFDSTQRALVQLEAAP